MNTFSSNQPKLSRAKISLAIATLVMVLTTINCGSSQESPSTSSPLPAAPTSTASASSNPVRVVALLDKTLSTTWTRTEHNPDPSEFEAVISLLRKTGGELAVGLIRDNSNKSLLRLPISPPPLDEPKAPNPDGENPFEYAEKQAKYEKDLAEYKERVDRWQSETDAQISSFMSKLEPLLMQAADADATDIAGALVRCDLFLSEPDEDPKRPAHRYAVLVSDGQDTVGGQIVPMQSRPKLLLVNGGGSLGSLEHLKPIRFENLRKAFQFIVSQEG
jgi:hypothetical protein